MSNNEPTYVYTKGIGWAPASNEMDSWEEQGFRITLARRDPGPGDRFYALNKGTELAYVRGLLQGSRWSINEVVGGKFEDYGPNLSFHFGNADFIVITVERL